MFLIGTTMQHVGNTSLTHVEFPIMFVLVVLESSMDIEFFLAHSVSSFFAWRIHAQYLELMKPDLIFPPIQFLFFYGP